MYHAALSASEPNPRKPGFFERLFGRDDAEPDAPAAITPHAAETRRVVERDLYDKVGHFLFTHGLDLTPLNFGCALDYLSGEDRPLTVAIEQAVREQRLSDAWIEDYLAGRQEPAISPDALIELAVRLEAEVDLCLDLIRRSASDAADYQQSLAVETSFVSPAAMIEHLTVLTRAMIAQTRRAETEMRRSHSQASQLRTTLRAARKASEVDHLTGLLNRRGFERRLGELCAAHATDERPVTLALCDIDHFKAVNDRFGHDTGDRVLKFIAQELKTLRRKGCEVARLGGEEFVVLLPDCDLDAATVAIDRVREKLAERNLIDASTKAAIGHITFSSGLAPLADPDGLRHALKLADGALYAAKRAGRNRIYAARADGALEPMPHA